MGSNWPKINIYRLRRACRIWYVSNALFFCCDIYVIYTSQSISQFGCRILSQFKSKPNSWFKSWPIRCCTFWGQKTSKVLFSIAFSAIIRTIHGTRICPRTDHWDQGVFDEMKTIKKHWRASKWWFWFNNAQIGQLVAQYYDLYILQLCHLFLSHVPSKFISAHPGPKNPDVHI